jgi:hypothetical protein
MPRRKWNISGVRIDQEFLETYSSIKIFIGGITVLS